MASTPVDPGGQNHNNTSHDNDNDNPMADSPQLTNANDPTATLAPEPTRTIEKRRLDNRTPLKRENDAGHSFPPATAFKNFMIAAFANHQLDLIFHSITDDTKYININTHPIPKDSVLEADFMRGALGRFEHEKTKYFSQFRVGLTHDTCFTEVKSSFLHYLQFHDSWLTPNKFLCSQNLRSRFV